MWVQFKLDILKIPQNLKFATPKVIFKLISLNLIMAPFTFYWTRATINPFTFKFLYFLHKSFTTQTINYTVIDNYKISDLEKRFYSKNQGHGLITNFTYFIRLSKFIEKNLSWVLQKLVVPATGCSNIFLNIKYH